MSPTSAQRLLGLGSPTWRLVGRAGRSPILGATDDEKMSDHRPCPRLNAEGLDYRERLGTTEHEVEPALNAFATTFADRWPAAETY